ncbi:hypothetical protein [Methylomonas sp. MgM2]
MKFYKSHVRAHTRKDGVFVAEYNTKVLKKPGVHFGSLPPWFKKKPEYKAWHPKGREGQGGRHRGSRSRNPVGALAFRR